MQLVIMELKKQ